MDALLWAVFGVGLVMGAGWAIVQARHAGEPEAADEFGVAR